MFLTAARFTPWVFGLLAVGGASPHPAAAQKLELVPQLGLYIPTRVTFEGNDVRLKQKLGVSAGFRLGLRFSEHFGIHTGLKYIPSHVALTNTSTSVKTDVDAHILAANAGVDLWILPKRKALSWVIRSGLALVSRGGAAYADLTGRMDLAGVVGGALRLRLGRMLSFHGGLDDYLYRADFNSGKLRNPRLQHDLHFSFGIGIPLLGFGE